MASALKKKELPANEYIFKEGEMGTAAYLILDGTVEIRLGAFGDTPKLLATLVTFMTGLVPDLSLDLCLDWRYRATCLRSRRWFPLRR